MSWWQYLLLVNIYLLLFYVFYAALLRKETFFQLNRIYLVTAALLSFFIPMIQADWVQNLFITQQVKYTIYSGQVMVYSLKPVAASHISIGQILAVLYITGIVFLSVRLIWQLIKLKRVINQPQATAAYSFFGTVKLDETNANNAIIEAHEQVHAQQWHSADVLLIELVMIINWFNPVVYLYRMAIKHIHEYIADRQAVQAGTNKAEYALLLLSQTFESPAHQLVNPFFNHSLLKQRIIMLQKNKSQRISLIKYGLSAPLFILMLILSSATINNSKTITVINKSAHQLFTTPAAATLLGKYNTEEATLAEETLTSKDEPDTTKKERGKVYTSVDRVPEFPGGLEAFGKFLGSHIKYPAADRENSVQGRVLVTFVVEKNGSLSGLKVKKGVSKTIDAEAVRVLKQSPKWNAGIVANKKVRVQYTVPISFNLSPETDGDKKADASGSTVHSSDEPAPEFPGGQEAFGKFLMTHLKYPAAAREKGMQGKVVISFIVEVDGSLSNMKVLRSVSPALDDEAVRVLEASPKWKPGMQYGSPVRTQYSVPINFTLNNDKAGKPGSDKKGSTGISTSSTDANASKTIASAKVINESPVLIIKDTPSSSTAPLYILDGKEIDEQVMKTIKSTDIESISVMKDKSSAAIYGKKGENGVILITTKAKKAEQQKSN